MSLTDEVVCNTRTDGGLISQLKDSKYPLLIYGAGEIAVDVYEWLEKRGIYINGFFIDDKPVRAEITLILGILITKTNLKVYMTILLTASQDNALQHG